MTNSTEIRIIADMRLEEAQLLYNNKFYEGAIYIAGYSVELLLKAYICDNLDIQNLFDKTFSEKEIVRPFKTHKLDHLLWLSGLKNTFDKDKATDKDLFAAWQFIIIEWSEEIRYAEKNTKTLGQANNIIDSINHPKYGIRQWILKH